MKNIIIISCCIIGFFFIVFFLVKKLKAKFKFSIEKGNEFIKGLKDWCPLNTILNESCEECGIHSFKIENPESLMALIEYDNKIHDLFVRLRKALKKNGVKNVNMIRIPQDSIRAFLDAFRY